MTTTDCPSPHDWYLAAERGTLELGRNLSRHSVLLRCGSCHALFEDVPESKARPAPLTAEEALGLFPGARLDGRRDTRPVALAPHRFTCPQGHEAWVAGLLPPSYVEVVVHDVCGRDPAVLLLQEESPVDRVQAVLDGSWRSRWGRRSDRAQRVRRALVLLADPSYDGLPYDVDALPGCPQCAAQPAERLPTGEPALPVRLPLLTWRTFDVLDAAGQEDRLHEVVDDALRA